MSFYLDANLLVALFAPDVHSAAADAWIDANPGELCVGDFARIEFTAVLSRRFRVEPASEKILREALGDFDEWARRMTTQIDTRPRDMALAEHLARDFALKLSAPDALHLALCENRDYTLVTFDMRLAEAARRRGAKTIAPS
ncbi:type II toxin-antitoxin system VapC family toxin [Methylosinus sp. Ce-a6]|uniref:type II toxin-antitoxin system VapC family toxin n=1 Tax=Methylosinus sp. Ce-a6 TaxID=2172005 RepID=UPI00135B737E|nr:type II toxin-antitoxin system VapC family toxin [Methylosinus sp. Ce-a6]